MGTILGILLILVIIAAVFGIRYWIAQGHIECVFAQDPALCVQVSELNDA